MGVLTTVRYAERTFGIRSAQTLEFSPTFLFKMVVMDLLGTFTLTLAYGWYTMVNQSIIPLPSKNPANFLPVNWVLLSMTIVLQCQNNKLCCRR